jgi:GNAT superfamily N-acetyltransferase
MTADDGRPEIVEHPDPAATFPVMRQLRPGFTEAEYVAAIARMANDGFHLVAVAQAGTVTAVAGYRLGESLAWGRYLYVDDLVTDEAGRSRGHGALLLDWLKQHAVRQDCRQLHLDSGVQRHRAHRFYLRERMDIAAYHFKVDLP